MQSEPNTPQTPFQIQVPTLRFERSEDDRVLAGVCGGVAATLGVDATLVRLVFALLALAGLGNIGRDLYVPGARCRRTALRH